MQLTRQHIATAVVFSILYCQGVGAEENESTLSTEQDDASASESAQIAEALANPLSYLWLLFVQNQTTLHDGRILDEVGVGEQAQNSLLIQPVLSLQMTDNWKAIFRPTIPINSFETVGNVNLSTVNPGQITGVDLQRQTGLGDIVLWTAFSRQYTPPTVWGFGPSIMLDTASDPWLGTGKTSVGPMALAFNISDDWIYGFVAQHWWSVSGDSFVKIETSQGTQVVERPDLSLTDIQPVLRKRISPETTIGYSPNIRYNWKTDQLSLPIGLGFDTLVKFGRLPVKVGVEAYYFIESDDRFGETWQIRFSFSPVIPSPGWARKALF